MTTWNLGSVASGVLMLVDNVPTRLSGAPLLLMADQARSYVQQRTGVTIGSNNINEPYQAPILHFTVADTLGQMSLDGADKGYSLGDLRVDNGASSSTTSTAQFYTMKAEKELKAIGFSVRSGRTY